MFGYVMVNEQELKLKDYEKYKSYYCGMCNALHEYFGVTAQLSLNFDMTFLAILLDGVYEPDKEVMQNRCIIHPLKKHMQTRSEAVDYAAKMNILLTYYKMLDDWNDEKKASGLLYSKALKGKCKSIENEYQNKAEKIRQSLNKLSQYEKNNEKNIDLVSGCFGELTSCIFRYKEDIFANNLARMGFYLGKFIYIMDAYEDVTGDEKKGLYNPFSDICHDNDFDDKIQELLMMMITECAKAFELLPVIDNLDILKNILYSGVWAKYEQVVKEKKNI